MNQIDKLTVLDTCVDGDLSKFKDLINPMYEQFNTFFHLCKSTIAPDIIESISYKNDINVAVFHVICKDTSHMSLLLNQSTSGIENVSISETETGVLINIPVKTQL